MASHLLPGSHIQGDTLVIEDRKAFDKHMGVDPALFSHYTTSFDPQRTNFPADDAGLLVRDFIANGEDWYVFLEFNPDQMWLDAPPPQTFLESYVSNLKALIESHGIKQVAWSS